MRRRFLALAGSLLLAIPVGGSALAATPAGPANPATASAHHKAKPKGASTSWTSLPAERTFPPDSGMLNVKTVYGAVGDGVHDDTAAIQAAISANIRKQSTSRIIYFPAGTYRVSKPLVWKDASNVFQSELTFQGENQQSTVIKLTDANPTFQNPAAPNGVIDMASLEPSGPQASSGGGNNGFDNYLFDLTVDVGKSNPGATAVDFLGNNYCGLRNVSLRSSDSRHTGAVGLSMTRYASGPCMMKNVSIDGFTYGIESMQQEYSLTFDNLALTNQLSAGILNMNNVLSIENLTSTNQVPAIENFGDSLNSQAGLVTLIDANLNGGSSTNSAIKNFQTLYARNVVTSGYRSALENASGPIAGTTVTEYDSGPVSTLFGGGSTSLKLPVQQTPEFEEPDLSKWASVAAFGGDQTGAKDSAAAVQAAIDSGATTVYFPAGQYIISSPVTVRGNVRMIEGFDSKVLPNGPTYTGTTVNPFFLFKNTVGVIVDHFRFGNANVDYPGLRFLEHESSQSVTIRDTVLDRHDQGSAYKNGVDGTGPLFLEDVVGDTWEILHPQNVFARQLDIEGKHRKILNQGGKLWILGIKTEHSGSDDNVAGNIDTELGGQTELLGGLVYPVTNPIPVNQAAFVINNSKASLIYAVSVHNPVSADPTVPDGDFKIQVQETQAGVTRTLTSVAAAAKAPRGSGLMMPLYTSKP